MTANSTKTPTWVSLPVLDTTREEGYEIQRKYAKLHGEKISVNALVTHLFKNVDVKDLPTPEALAAAR